MTARGKARKRALDVLYASELRGVAAGVVLREGPLAEGAAQVAPAANPYVATLVEGVVAHQVRIDELLSTYSARAGRSTGCRQWTATSCGSASTSCLWRDDVPDAVVIDEAVNLVRGLSTDESPAFVNGVLARILDLRPRLAV